MTGGLTLLKVAKLLFGFLFLGSQTSVAGAVEAGLHVSAVLEPNKEWSIEEAIAAEKVDNFRIVTNTNFGRVDRAVWLRVDVKQSIDGSPLEILIPYAGLARLDAYQQTSDGEWTVLKAGLSVGFTEEPTLMVPQFRIPVVAATLWLRAESPFTLRVPMKVLSVEKVRDEMVAYSSLYMALLGMISFVFIHHFAQFLGSGRVIHLLHGSRVLFLYVILPFATSGAVVAMFPKASLEESQRWILLSAALGSSLLGLFTVKILETPKLLTRLMQVMIGWGFVMSSIAAFAWPDGGYEAVVNPTILQGVSVILLVCLLFLRDLVLHRCSQTLWFLVGISGLLAGVLAYVLNVEGIADLGLIGEFGIILGGAFEAMSMSIGLGRQVKGLEQTALLVEHERATNRKFHTFVQILCHDLTNGLTRILMACQARERSMLKNLRGSLDSEVKFVRRVEGAAKHIHNIITNVRELEAVALGKKKMSLEPCDLREIALDSIMKMAHKLHEKQVGVKICNPQEPVEVLANAGLLVDSVVINLLSNGAKFSQAGSDLEVLVDEWQGFGVIRVTDSGVGMPEEIRSRVFESDVVTTRQGTGGEKGTGFGMPLAKTLVEQFGGFLDVVSSEDPEDHGTTFVILLPLGIQQSKRDQPAKFAFKSLFPGLRRQQAVENPATLYLQASHAPFEASEHLTVHDLHSGDPSVGKANG